MSRKNHQISIEHPYHVTSRTCNRTSFSLPMEDLWSLYSDYLYLCHKFFNFQIHSFVLMNNHYHLLVTTPEGNLSQGMLYLQREVSKKINTYSKKSNQNFGGRYFRCIIPNYHYYLHCYKYVYRNPIEAGICKKVEDYRFSTFRGLIGYEHLLIPLVEDQLAFNGSIEKHIEWLNLKPKTANYKIIREALKGSQFSLPIERSSRRANFLDSELY